MLTTIVGVVVLLGGLIFFHELGHYTVAKLFRVKVEVFSLGFGKKLFSWKLGETEYCLSIFPLGGYVKLMGDDPYKGVAPADADRAFSTQKLHKRFLIVAAGPVANLALAIVLFMFVFWFGQPTPGTRLGNVTYASPAWQAGLRAQDRIVEVDGAKAVSWSDLEEKLRAREGQRVELLVARSGAELRIPVVVGKMRARNEYLEDVEVGGIKGMSPVPLAPMIGVSDPRSLAFQSGLRTGDLVTKIDSRSVALYDDLNEALAADWKPGKPLVVTVRRKPSPESKDEGVEKSFNLTLPGTPDPAKVGYFGVAEALGIFPSDVFVLKVNPESAADKGGLKAGDRVVRIGDEPILNFETIVDRVQEQGPLEPPVRFVLERDGQAITLLLKPVPTEQEDPLTHQKVFRYLVGFAPMTALHEPDLVKIQVRQPIELVQRAVNETWSLTRRMVVSLSKLVVGRISVKNLGGPVLIASVAGRSLDAGVIPFIQMMALISINLFLLNLFPIPVLDGGHLLFFAIEAVKGRPVSIRTMEIAHQVGMVFILMLVGLTLFNDISRIVLH